MTTRDKTIAPKGAVLTRRAAAKLMAGTAAAAATVIAAPRLARAAGKTVYLLTWGGTIQAMLERDHWAKKFADATGYNVVLVPKATGPEIANIGEIIFLSVTR